MKDRPPPDASEYIKWVRQKANLELTIADAKMGIPAYERHSVVSQIPTSLSLRRSLLSLFKSNVVREGFGLIWNPSLFGSAAPTYVYAIAFDSADILYLALNRKIYRNGIEFLEIGGGSDISFMAFRTETIGGVRDEYFYVRYEYSRIRKYRVSDKSLVCTFSFVNIGGSLPLPANLKYGAFDSAGNLIVTLWDNDNLIGSSSVAYVTAAQLSANVDLTISTSPWTETFRARYTANSNRTDGCFGIVVDASDNIYVACRVSGRVIKLSSVAAGTWTVTDLITTGVKGAVSLALGYGQNLYVAVQDIDWVPNDTVVTNTSYIVKTKTIPESLIQRLDIVNYTRSVHSGGGAIGGLMFDRGGHMYYINNIEPAIYKSTSPFQ